MTSLLVSPQQNRSTDEAPISYENRRMSNFACIKKWAFICDVCVLYVDIYRKKRREPKWMVEMETDWMNKKKETHKVWLSSGREGKRENWCYAVFQRQSFTQSLDLLSIQFRKNYFESMHAKQFFAIDIYISFCTIICRETREQTNNYPERMNPQTSNVS